MLPKGFQQRIKQAIRTGCGKCGRKEKYRSGQSGEEFGNVTDKAKIRNETSADVSAIAELTAAAFRPLAISSRTEHRHCAHCAPPGR